MILSVFIVFFSVAASYKVEKIAATSLLLDLYNSDVIEKCDFRKLSSIAPMEINPGATNSNLIFNLSLKKLTESIHVVFDREGPAPHSAEKSLGVLINGHSETVNLSRIRNSSIARVDRSKVQGSTNLTVSMRELAELNFTLEKIFFMTGVDESCEAWKAFRDGSESTKSSNDHVENRSISKRAVGRGCARIPFEVDLRDIRRADDEEAEEFIYTPLTYDIGTCGNRCLLSQYTPHALLRSVLRENIDLKQNHTVYTHEVLKPACLPTGFGPLQILFFSRVDNVMRLRLFKNVVVKQCGCI